MQSSALLVDLTVRSFVEKLGAGDPVPGGGSASALAGSLGAALTGMVARLTIGRPRYAKHEVEMKTVLSQADRLRGQLIALVDADTCAYQNVIIAYRLPKDTDERRAIRTAAIQEALRHATDIPLATAEACVQVLNLAAFAVTRGNPHAASDAVVASLLAHAAFLGAAHDVRTNLKMINDEPFCSAAEARISGLVSNAEMALQRALAA